MSIHIYDLLALLLYFAYKRSWWDAPRHFHDQVFRYSQVTEMLEVTASRLLYADSGARFEISLIKFLQRPRMKIATSLYSIGNP